VAGSAIFGQHDTAVIGAMRIACRLSSAPGFLAGSCASCRRVHRGSLSVSRRPCTRSWCAAWPPRAPRLADPGCRPTRRVRAVARGTRSSVRFRPAAAWSGPGGRRWDFALRMAPGCPAMVPTPAGGPTDAPADGLRACAEAVQCAEVQSYRRRMERRPTPDWLSG
jgi:hypothetical protein